jgi:DNA-binding winged helix-turn-helix (wHTH) protein/Tfp pilus assembly protein PilF
MSNLYRFADFALDPARRTLSRADSPISLTPRAFDVLLFLAQNPNRLVTKEELLQAVWGDTNVEEGNLTQYISHLRKAMDDNSDDNHLIVTIARKGYQLSARVTVSEAAATAKNPTLQAPATETLQNDARSVEFSAEEKVAKSPSPLARLRFRRWFAATALLAVFAAAFWLYWSHRRRMTLSATDTIVLAEVKNDTSDPLFTDALDTALRYEMEQTPYLNILGIDKVFGTLAQLKLPPTTILTAEVASQVCRGTNSKLVIAASIADAGNGFRIGIDAEDCQSGKILTGIRKEAANRNQVVHVLGVAGAQLRRNLGEPTASLTRFNKPLDEALTSSIEALQVGTLGYKRQIAGDAEGAIAYYQGALEVDPNLAPTYVGLGAAYNGLHEQDLAATAFTKAYELRGRMTEPIRLLAEYLYFAWVTGEREKALPIVSELVQTFPENVTGRQSMTGCLSFMGQPDKAADQAREAARLQPSPATFGLWALSSILADRLNEAEAVLNDAAARKFDSYSLRDDRIRLAFLQNDQRAMLQQLNLPISRSDADQLLVSRSKVEEYHGRFRSARKLIQQAVAMAPDAPVEPSYKTGLFEAESGNLTRARQMADVELKAVSDREEKLCLALTFARAGNTEQAGKMADALSQESPLDTLVQNYFLPTIRAAMKLNANDPAGAVAVLRPSLKYELAYNLSITTVYPAYIRGLAYLQLGEGRLAAAEFQKFVDHKSLVGRDVLGALAHLQMARAQKMMGDEASARDWYKDFLTLWKDADPDIPIYQQAKAEYAKLK